MKLKSAALHMSWCLATVHFCNASISFFCFLFFFFSFLLQGMREEKKKSHFASLSVLALAASSASIPMGFARVGLPGCSKEPN